MESSYFRACTSPIFWLKETVAHPSLRAKWRECSGVDGWGRAHLDAYIREKLSKLLYHAATTVPYYKARIDGQKIRNGSLTVEDFPIISKQDIRGHETEFLSNRYNLQNLERQRTSGSTGEPFVFYRSKESFDYTYATLWRGLLRFGIRPGHKRAFIKGIYETANPSAKVRVLHRLNGLVNKCIFVDAHFLASADANIKAALDRILGYRPRYIHGYASTIHLLAQYAERNNIDCSHLNLLAVITESEKCHSFQRETIERVFHAPVVENYGSVEFGMIAQPGKDGRLYINEDHVYVETTTDAEAVFTNLDEYGFPLIRFKNGDKLTLGGAGGELPYKTIKSIEGRVAETIYLPQGGSLQGYIVMYPISKHMKYLREYQVYQPDIDNLFVRVVESEPLPTEIEAQIVSEMRKIVGDVINVKVQKVNSIPLTKRGKRAFVCSEVR